MKHTIPRGSWQDSGRQRLTTPRQSAVDPADLALDSRVRCRICERTPYALAESVVTGGLLDRRSVLMVLTDADDHDLPGRVVDRAICRPCATRTDGELARSRPLLDVLVRALLREWRCHTNGSAPPAPRLVVEMARAAAKEYKIAPAPPATDDEITAYKANHRVSEAIAPDIAGDVAGDNLDDSVETDLDSASAWDQMVLAALPTLAVGGRIGLPEWRVIGVAGE